MFVWQAKLKLLILDLKGSQKILNLAQETAEKYNLNVLSEKVSSEQEKLHNNTDKWLILNEAEKKAMIYANLTPVKDQINYMLQKRRILNL